MRRTIFRASSCEPGNWAGSVTGTNSVVCSYGKFQPDRPGWIQETRPNSSGGTKTCIVRDCHSFVDSCILLIKLIRILLKWKYKAKIMPFWPLCCESKAIFPKMFRLGHRAGVFMLFIWENHILSPVTKISETEPAPLIGLTYEEAVKRPLDALSPEFVFWFSSKITQIEKDSTSWRTIHACLYIKMND